MLKTSLTLFFVVSVIFSTIYTPQAILPTLQSKLDLSMTQTNLLLSGMLFVLMLSSPFYAPLSRYFQMKKIMLFSISALFLSVLLSAFASGYDMLLISRILQGIFIPGITAIMLSYVQEIYPKEHRGLGMGIYMSATAFGGVMGRLLAGKITYLYSWREAFLFFALLLVVAFVAMKFGLPDVDRKSIGKVEKNSIFKYLKNIEILSILLIPMVVFFSFLSITTYITYHLTKAPFSLNDSQLADIFLVLLLAVIVAPIVGRYSDLIGRVKVLYLGIISLIFGMVLTLHSSLVVIIVGIAFVTIGMFSVQSVAPTYLGEKAPEHRRVLSVLYQTFFYFGGAMGTLLPTFAWNYGEYRGVVFLCLGLVVLAIIPLSFLKGSK